MHKNIVICSDGTGNSSNKDRGTNVFKLYEALDLNNSFEDVSRQFAFYDDGVGTEDNKIFRMLTGAVGFGLTRNVKHLYREIVHAYEPGAHLYFFGFSRGAFTVRTLVGLIARFGILDLSGGGDERKAIKSNRELKRAVNHLYAAYRYNSNALLTWPLKFWAFLMRRRPQDICNRYHFKNAENDFTLRFIGVWDTVDAVGLPWDRLADFVDLVIYKFKFCDKTLNPRVKKACHALAIDDERATFHPVMWDESEETDPERIQQVWFAGAHANVGGGYPKQGMSLVTLDWMMAHAQRAGLHFIDTDGEFYVGHRNVTDKLYDSRAGLAAYYRYKSRDIAAICGQTKEMSFGAKLVHTTRQTLETCLLGKPAVVRKPKIHISALARIAMAVKGYAPGNLPREFDVVGGEHYLSDRQRRESVTYPSITRPFELDYGDSTLLQRTRFLDWICRMGHFTLTLTSIYFLYILYRVQRPEIPKGAGVFEKVQIFFSTLAGIPTLPFGKMIEAICIAATHWLVVAGFLFSIAGSFLAYPVMQSIYSGFWYRQRKMLKKFVENFRDYS